MTVLSDQLRTHYFGADSPDIDGSTAADFAPAVPITVYEFGVIATTAVVHNSADCVVNAVRRPVAGSASNQVTLDSLVVIENAGTLAAGTGRRKKIGAAAPAGTTYDNMSMQGAPAGPYDVIPGQSFAIVIGTASASGAVRGWVRYTEHGLNGQAEMVNITDMTVYP